MSFDISSSIVPTGSIESFMMTGLFVHFVQRAITASSAWDSAWNPELKEKHLLNEWITEYNNK